jgi:DNA (cytosine-5)-methyltransferase 1
MTVSTAGRERAPTNRRRAAQRALWDDRFRAAEFFAGIGLVRLALERHNFRVDFANDICPDKFAMYEANFGAGHFRLGDVHALAAEQLPQCDLFTASFPCNDLSIAGGRKGIHSGQSSAYWGFLNVVQELGPRRPAVILLENVPGFLTSHGGRDFEAALLALNELGYAVDALFLDAAWFVPQSRVRLFVVARQGAREDRNVVCEPSPLRPPALVEFMRSHPEILWDMADLPAPEDAQPQLTDILEDLPDDDPRWWNIERTAYFMNQLSPRHAAVAERMIADDEIGYATAFRRVRKGRSMAELRTDGIAGCLRTPRGGSGRQILFKAGRGQRQVRLLTPRECARLQGVPDEYVINASPNQALFGFGDAVCVPAVAWIVGTYLQPLLQAFTSRESG